MQIAPNVIMRVPIGEQQGMRLSLGFGYEQELTERMIAALKPGDVFVDVGANMGYFSLLASERVGADGLVMAFEPCPGNFAWLARNLQSSRTKNVLASFTALSEQSGIGHISIPPYYNNGVAALQTELNGHPVMPVITQRFDDLPDALVRRAAIRLVKIDTEGHELSVLRGMEQTLRRAQPLAVACELTPAWTCVRSIVDLLEDCGFSGEYFSDGQWNPITARTEFPAQCNGWFAKNG